jgi:uncharacterized coiled-coil protein SlyX
MATANDSTTSPASVATDAQPSLNLKNSDTPTVVAQASPPSTTPAPTPSTVDVSSSLKAAEARVAELEAALKSNSDVIAKLRDVFGASPEKPVDPAAEAAALKAQAEKAQALAAKAIVAAEVARYAAKEGAHDLEDVADYVASRNAVEIDWLTGRVKNPADVAAKVAEVKTTKPHWFRVAAESATPASHPVPLTGRAPAPTPAPSAPPPSPRMSALDLWTKPLASVRNVVTGGSKTPM